MFRTLHSISISILSPHPTLRFLSPISSTYSALLFSTSRPHALLLIHLFSVFHPHTAIFISTSLLQFSSLISPSRNGQSSDGSGSTLPLHRVLRRGVSRRAALSGHRPPQDVHRQSETQDAEEGERHEYVCLLRFL
jgi:hypothetical protein